MERKSLLVSKGLGRGRSKRELFAHDSSASFFFSYNVWFCLFAFNVFITYRLSCGTTKAEFYFQQEVKLAAGPYLSPGGGGGGREGPIGLDSLCSVAEISIGLKQSPQFLTAQVLEGEGRT